MPTLWIFYRRKITIFSFFFHCVLQQASVLLDVLRAYSNEHFSPKRRSINLLNCWGDVHFGLLLHQQQTEPHRKRLSFSSDLHFYAPTKLNAISEWYAKPNKEFINDWVNLYWFSIWKKKFSPSLPERKFLANIKQINGDQKSSKSCSCHYIKSFCWVRSSPNAKGALSAVLLQFTASFPIFFSLWLRSIS